MVNFSMVVYLAKCSMGYNRIINCKFNIQNTQIFSYIYIYIHAHTSISICVRFSLSLRSDITLYFSVFRVLIEIFCTVFLFFLFVVTNKHISLVFSLSHLWITVFVRKNANSHIENETISFFFFEKKQWHISYLLTSLILSFRKTIALSIRELCHSLLLSLPLFFVLTSLHYLSKF